MDIKELHSFKMSDAVTFHDKLNPKLFVGQKLRPEVELQLKTIAEDFLQEMGIHDLDVRDITISGSNAAYSYTDHSDLDLHILVNMADLPNDEVYREFFKAKKDLYNDSHDISIHGIPVELYIQDAAEPVVSLGEYSVTDNKWLRLPTKRRSNFDQTATKAKYEKMLDVIKTTLQTKNIHKVDKILKKIKQYRQAGLDKGGEFGPENLAYKALRSQGYITKLYDLRDKLHSKRLSLNGMYSNMDEDYDPNGVPPGPEFKPTMPAGTVRVDVSDVYDWYKLGQHISDLGHTDPKMFGKGPPSTIMAFGSEPEEHKYINDLKKLGLTTTDIDPVDPNQPKGMKRQKVDPTYNVNEAFNQPYKLKWEKGDHGDIDAIAKLPDGNYLSIMFNKEENDEGEEAWSVEFFRNNSQEVTGEGDAQRVFATVLGAIQTFIKKYKPNRVIFSASKEVEQGQNAQSRARLYDSLVQRYSKAWGFRAFRADTGNKVIYELNRITKEVAEGLINEYRDRLLQYVKSLLPTWPEYVLKDWLVPNKGDFSNLPDTELKNGIMEKLKFEGLSPNTKWQLVPNMKFTMDMFEPMTTKRLIGRAGGHSDMGLDVPRDKERHATQAALAQQQGGVRKEPVLLIKTSKGYELLEGWHRTIQHFAKYPQGYTGPAYVAVAQGQQGVAEDFGDEEAMGRIEPYGGIYIFLEEDGDEVFVQAMYKPAADGSTEMGHVLFVQEGDYLMPQDLEVEEKYQGQGIASTMYDYVKSKGYKIRRSGQQTDAGAGFWDKHRPNQNVWEASGYIPSEKEKNDPRFKTALTVDVKPDSIKKNAKSFYWKTSRAGIPPTANPSGKIS